MRCQTSTWSSKVAKQTIYRHQFWKTISNEVATARTRKVELRHWPGRVSEVSWHTVLLFIVWALSVIWSLMRCRFLEQNMCNMVPQTDPDTMLLVILWAFSSSSRENLQLCCFSCMDRRGACPLQPCKHTKPGPFSELPYLTFGAKLLNLHQYFLISIIKDTHLPPSLLNPLRDIIEKITKQYISFILDAVSATSSWIFSLLIM